jgi:hypothetical protein
MQGQEDTAGFISAFAIGLFALAVAALQKEE